MTVTTYECPRCGYEVKNKTDMRRHFERQRVCKDNYGLVLTPEIVEYVLENYKYTVSNRRRSRSAPTQSIINSSESTVRFADTEVILPTSIPVDSCSQSVDNSIISGINPLSKQTACGKNVWVLYAKSSETAPKMPIRVVTDSGSRKMHLFDFIKALSGCDDNVRNEWERIVNKLEKEIVTKITISQKIRFPEIHQAKFTRSDSMVIDIYQAAKVALAIGTRANWFNEILTSLGTRFLGGDPELVVDVEYMNIAQRIISEYEPDNFLRLWGEEFLANSQVAQIQRETSNPENLINSMTETAADIMEDCNITQETVRRSRTRSGGRRRTQSARSYPSYKCTLPKTRATIGSLYLYQIIFRCKTREEALNYLKSIGVTLDHLTLSSTILCEDDLGGRILVKVGKTGDLCIKRQIDYINRLAELYWIELEKRLEYEIDFVANLEEMENAAKAALYTSKPVTLLRANEKTLCPNEVFAVESLDMGDRKVKEVVEKYQIGAPITLSYNESNELKLKLKREETQHADLKAKEAESKAKEAEYKMRRTQYQLEILKLLGNNLQDDLVRLVLSE